MIPSNYYENFTSPPSTSNRFNFVFISDVDIVKHVMKIKSNEVGLASIHPLFVKLLLPKLLPYLAHIFNSILRTTLYPTQWKRAKKFQFQNRLTTKIFKSILNEQISNFLAYNNILHSYNQGSERNTALLHYSAC